MTKKETKKSDNGVSKGAIKQETDLGPSKPPLWVDSVTMAVRDDNICLLDFSAKLPEGRYEQAKIITTSNHLKKIVGLICNALDYYPEKTNKQSEPSTKNIKDTKIIK